MDRYRWVVLGVATFAQLAFSAVLQGIPAIAPAVRDDFDLSLSQLGLVIAALAVGCSISLIPWGFLSDRFGSRKTLLIGLIGCAAFLGATSLTSGVVAFAALFFMAGIFGGVTSVAGGRAVLSWFSPASRGTALGIRQTAVPLGAALGAVTLPAIAARAGVDAALVALAGGCAVAALVSGVWIKSRSAPVPEQLEGPTPLSDRRMWILAAATFALAYSQLAIITFAVLYLNEERSFTPQAAGVVLAVMQVLAAVGRIALGRWSDRIGSRVVPLRRLSWAITLSWVFVVLLFGVDGTLFVAMLVVAGTLSISWNALSFTAAAEFAGEGRAGTAIGMQQTIVFGSAAIVAPAFGSLVEAIDWRWSFFTLALSPIAAWAILGSLDEPAFGSQSRS